MSVMVCRRRFQSMDVGLGGVGAEDGDEAFRGGGEIGPVEFAFALAGALFSHGQQAGQAGVGRAVGWVDQD